MQPLLEQSIPRQFSPELIPTSYQANNEEVRIYALAVNILDAAGTVATSETDFTVAIQCGPNNVPSNSFDIRFSPTLLMVDHSSFKLITVVVSVNGAHVSSIRMLDA